MLRTCNACGFQAKKYGSLERHVNHCQVAQGRKRRRIARPEIYLEEDEIARLREAIFDDVQDTDNLRNGDGSSGLDDKNITLPSDDFPTELEEQLGSLYSIVASVNANVYLQSSEQVNSTPFETLLPPQAASGALSSSSSLRIEQYHSLTGRSAGEPVLTTAEPDCEESSTRLRGEDSNDAFTT